MKNQKVSTYAHLGKASVTPLGAILRRSGIPMRRIDLRPEGMLVRDECALPQNVDIGVEWAKVVSCLHTKKVWVDMSLIYGTDCYKQVPFASIRHEQSK